MNTILGTATGSNADHVDVWIEWQEGTIDYANNRSYVYAWFYAQTKSTASSSTYDNNGGNSNFYVNSTRVGGIVNGKIDFRSASPYNRPRNVLGTWEDWVTHDPNGNATVTFSGNFSLSSSYISGGNATGMAGLKTIFTGVSAPSNLRYDQNIFENNLTFYWDPGAPGVNNAIVGYHVYYWVNGAQYGPFGCLSTETSKKIDTSGFARGASLYFQVASIAQRGDGNPFSQPSNTITRNRLPITPTNVSMSKAVYVPGEMARVNFTNNGDLDGNLQGFQVDINGSGTAVPNTISGSGYVAVPTAGLTPGVRYSFRVRAYDTLGAYSEWSSPLVYALVGLPMKVVVTQGDNPKQVAQMKVVVTQGDTAKTVKSMKLAVTQGNVFKNVF